MNSACVLAWHSIQGERNHLWALCPNGQSGTAVLQLLPESSVLQLIDTHEQYTVHCLQSSSIIASGNTRT